MSFSDLKKNKTKQLEALTSKLTAGNQYQQDETYWKLTPDAAGNASAIIRFLPAPPGEEDPFITLYRHQFLYPDTQKWYIENSLSTLGQDDPMKVVSKRVWDSGDKELYQLVKRKTEYHTNIYVVDDKGNPDNNGKVFKYKYGKMIADIVKLAFQPEDEDEASFNPFDLWEGANFRLKQYMKKSGLKNFPQYDKSKFETPSPLFDDDDKMEAVWNSEYSLQSLIAPDKFKTFAELQARLNIVLGEDATPVQQVATKNQSTAEKFAATKTFDEEESPAAEAVVETADDDDWLKELED